MNVKGISYNISSKWVSDMYIIFADLYIYSEIYYPKVWIYLFIYLN